LDINDNLGFAQLFGEAFVLAAEFVGCFLQRITFRFGTALLGSESLAHAGLALPPPGRQQR
jgi:hypothetical protein